MGWKSSVSRREGVYRFVPMDYVVFEERMRDALIGLEERLNDRVVFHADPEPESVGVYILRCAGTTAVIDPQKGMMLYDGPFRGMGTVVPMLQGIIEGEML